MAGGGAIGHDLRSAIRQIWRNPGHAAAVLLTLALGVGAVTAVLTLADRMLFRALPFPAADRIVVLGARGGRLHIPDAVRLESLHSGFAGLGDFEGPIDIGRIGSAREPSISFAVSRGFLPALGVRPALGRAFRADEYRRGRSDVAMITHAVWRSSFGGRMDVIGQRLTFAGSLGHSYEIVGVLPREFFFPNVINSQPAALIPGALDPSDVRPNRIASPIARLRDGITPETAAAEMQAILTSVEREFPRFEQGRKASLTPLRESLFGDVRTPLLMLVAATVCVMLLASANLAQLILARLRARRRELGVRLAIGASRWRITRQLAFEGLVLSSIGAVAALVAGAWLSRLVLAYLPPIARVYRIMPTALDLRIVAIAAALIFVSFVVFGVVPAWLAARLDIRSSLQSGAGASHGRGSVGSDAVLIFVQAALGVALLLTGLLIVRSFVSLVSIPRGFEPERTRMLSVELSPTIARDIQRTRQVQLAIYHQLRDRLHLPVALAGGIPSLHLSSAVTRPEFDVRNLPVNAWPVGGSFLDVFGLKLVAGRAFSDEEALSNAPVAVIDQRAAGLLWPGVDPLGHTVKELDGTVRTIVGIVRTFRTSLRDEALQKGGAFVPFGSRPRPYMIVYREDGRVSARDITAVVDAIAPGTLVTTAPLVTVFDRQLAQPRFLAVLLGSLGALALLLTLVGVVGIVSHEVSRRTRELGIRIALGADAGRIRRLVVGRALRPALPGGLLGLSGALWATEGLRSLLFGFSPQDPLVYVVTLAIILVSVMAASVVPAWRASRTDPMTSLRAD